MSNPYIWWAPEQIKAEIAKAEVECCWEQNWAWVTTKQREARNKYNLLLEAMEES